MAAELVQEQQLNVSAALSSVSLGWFSTNGDEAEA
jgi:hypothetical protein